MNRKVVLGIGGSSGSVYAERLMRKMTAIQDLELAVVMSTNAKINWDIEIGPFSEKEWPFKFYHKSDFMAPFASGSARFETMIICPCSMGLIGRVANGISDDLICRAADVVLKERRKLIIVPRETPYNLIHLRNMTTLTEAGGIICPASPSFYSKPADITAVIDTVVDRVLDLAGFSIDSYRWGS
ncbi:MAG: UbiX family flavin prenyltransferase [Saprospiraceae bacterium]|nr:UbiX family flavin prenyltransferase [Saprospiraceae bacterium]